MRARPNTGLWAGAALAAAMGLVMHGAQAQAAAEPRAVARLVPTYGHGTTGTVSFTQHADGTVTLRAQVDGLIPWQEHGFHLHEKGDCSSGDGQGTGGHFNPDGQPHGPQHAEHHAGDLPALRADASGHAELQAELSGVTVAPGPRSVVGRGLIVHGSPDDYATQPTGNSGARIACGVVLVD